MYLLPGTDEEILHGDPEVEGASEVGAEGTLDVRLGVKRGSSRLRQLSETLERSWSLPDHDSRVCLFLIRKFHKRSLSR